MVLILSTAMRGQLYPLLTWEKLLRARAGLADYSESFIHNWLRRLLFSDAAHWVFTTIYLVFTLVLLLFWLRDWRRM